MPEVLCEQRNDTGEAMPSFANRKLVLEFEYREVYVEIFQALMGATHCDQDHQPEQKKCDVCGKPIRPIKVHIISIFGNDVEVLVNVTPLAAQRLAEQMIDDVIDRTGGDGEVLGDGRPGNGRGDDRPLEPIDLGDPPGLPEPPDQGDERGRGHRSLVPSNRLARIADRMKKLGWPMKALNIIRDELRKRGK